MPEHVAGLTIPVLSRYEIALTIDAVLGRGGMGVVLKAYDKLLDRAVAIKTINPSLVALSHAHDDFERRLFFREAMAHARLGIQHPECIVRVNNYGIEDDTPFMEMDILEGGSLQDRMDLARAAKRRGPLFDESTIKVVCTRVCEALKLLHREKVYHSDLKPGNVLFTAVDGWDLKVADLGIARIAQSGFLTKAGIATFAGGSMHYTPQEVVEGVKKADERTDVYSLGVILFELVAGERLLWSQAHREFVERHPSLPSGTKDLVKRACQLIGRNNLKSAEAFQERLNNTALLE
jgi:serine/threonine protein kinase